jgi:hypothetical protein
MLATLKKHPDYISHKTVAGTFKGEKVKYIHVYMKKTVNSNPWGLETFSSADGKGYLIEFKQNKSKNMATAKKAAPKRKKSPSAKKICRSVIKQEGVNQRTGKLKTGYKYKKGGGVVKVKAKK